MRKAHTDFHTEEYTNTQKHKLYAHLQLFDLLVRCLLFVHQLIVNDLHWLQDKPEKQIRLTTLHGLYFWLCQWPRQKLTCVRHPRKAAYYQAAWRSRRAWAWHVYVHGSADQSAGRTVLPSAVCQSSSPATPRRPRRHGGHWVTLRLKTRQRDRQISVVLLAMRIDKS